MHPLFSSKTGPNASTPSAKVRCKSTRRPSAGRPPATPRPTGWSFRGTPRFQTPAGKLPATHSFARWSRSIPESGIGALARNLRLPARGSAPSPLRFLPTCRADRSAIGRNSFEKCRLHIRASTCARRIWRRGATAPVASGTNSRRGKRASARRSSRHSPSTPTSRASPPMRAAKRENWKSGPPRRPGWMPPCRSARKFPPAFLVGPIRFGRKSGPFQNRGAHVARTQNRHPNTGTHLLQIMT